MQWGWEDEGCVLFYAFAMFVLCFYGCGGWCFWRVHLQGVEHGILLRMCEAYPAVALLMCGGEPLCWWIKSWLGGLERGGWLRYWGSIQMICLSANIIYVHALKQPMYCRKGDKKLSWFSESSQENGRFWNPDRDPFVRLSVVHVCFRAACWVNFRRDRVGGGKTHVFS